MGQNLGTQIKIWLPESMYSTVRELAAAHTDGNISQAVRVLLQRGLERDALDNAAAEVVHRVTSQLDHLERLLYFTAQQAAMDFASTERTTEITAKQMAGQDAAKAQAIVDRTMAYLRETATERVRRALRERNPVLASDNDDADA